MSRDEGGCGDRAGRGGTTGAFGADIVVFKLAGFIISLGPTIPASTPRASLGLSTPLLRRQMARREGEMEKWKAQRGPRPAE